MTNEIAKEEKATEPKSGIKHIILLIHGIQSYGNWHQTVENVFNTHPDVEVVSVKYGSFSVWRFLLPWDMSKKQQRLVYREYMASHEEWPNAKISVIAHSFGTHILTQLFKRKLKNKEHLDTYENPFAGLERILLCGAVIKQDFDWKSIARYQEGRRLIINDCGNSDIWPILGSKFGWHYGTAGTDGTSGPYVKDRYHNGNHSLFFDKDFIEKYWVSFLLGGEEIVPGNALQGEKIPLYIKPFRIVPAPILKLIMFALIGFSIYWFWSDSSPTTMTFESFMTDYRQSLGNNKQFMRYKEGYEDTNIILTDTPRFLMPHYLGEKNTYLVGIKKKHGYQAVAVLKDSIQEEYSIKGGPFDIAGTVSTIGYSVPVIEECVFTKPLKAKNIPLEPSN